MCLKPGRLPADLRGGASWKQRLVDGRLIVLATWTATTQDDLTGRAAQLAYYFFFALFPSLIAASAMLGMVASSGRNLSDRLIGYLGTVIPPAALDLVSQAFSQTVSASSGGKVLVGVVVALWSASAGTSAIQDALNSVHKVKDDRPFWEARLEAIGLTVAIVMLFTAALTVMLGGDIAAGNLNKMHQAPLLFKILTRVLSWPIAFAIISIAFALVYYIGPAVKHAKWRWITPGSTIGILLWLIASAGLRLYLRFFNSYSLTYGSLGAVIVLLTWFYLTGLSILLGAEVNMVIDDLAARRPSDGKSMDPPEA